MFKNIICILLVILFIGFWVLMYLMNNKNAKKYKENIDYLRANGKRVTAEVIDYIIHRSLHRDIDGFLNYDECIYPVLKFLGDDNKEHIQIYFRDAKIVKTNYEDDLPYEIGTKVSICYIEKNIELEQLNLEKKFFKGKYNSNIKPLQNIKKNKRFIFLKFKEDEIGSIKYGNNIPVYPTTRIRENDIYIIEKV